MFSFLFKKKKKSPNSELKKIIDIGLENYFVPLGYKVIKHSGFETEIKKKENWGNITYYIRFFKRDNLEIDTWVWFNNKEITSFIRKISGLNEIKVQDIPLPDGSFDAKIADIKASPDKIIRKLNPSPTYFLNLTAYDEISAKKAIESLIEDYLVVVVPFLKNNFDSVEKIDKTLNSITNIDKPLLGTTIEPYRCVYGLIAAYLARSPVYQDTCTFYSKRIQSVSDKQFELIFQQVVQHIKNINSK